MSFIDRKTRKRAKGLLVCLVASNPQKLKRRSLEEIEERKSVIVGKMVLFGLSDGRWLLVENADFLKRSRV